MLALRGGDLARAREVLTKWSGESAREFTTGDAVRVAEELLTRENVSFLAGTFLSNVGLAVSNLANQRKVLFLASEPLTDKINEELRAYGCRAFSLYGSRLQGSGTIWGKSLPS